MSDVAVYGGIVGIEGRTTNIGQEATIQADGALHFGKNDG